MVSHQAFGVRVRKVQMARGNRQGNNAFMEKLHQAYMRNEDAMERTTQKS